MASVDDFFSADTGASTTGTTTLVLTVPRAVAAGKKLVLAHGRADVSGSTVVGLTSVADSKGNTWAVNDAVSIRANQGGVSFAHCDVTTALAAGDTITATMSASSARKFMDVWVCSGLPSGAPNATTGSTATANTNSNANGSSSTPTATLTTTSTTTLVLAAAYSPAAGIPATPGSGYTRDGDRTTTDTAPKGWASEHQVFTSSGSKTASFTLGASGAWAMAAVAFTATGNAAPTADAGPNQVNVAPWSTVQLDATASADSDGTIVGYFWQQTGGTTATLDDARSATPTYQAPGTLAGDTQTWQVTVTDDGGATGSAPVSIFVLLAPELMMVAGGWTPVKWGLITADAGPPPPPPAGELTLTVTAEPDAEPPRIRIDVADTRTPPANQLTVTRRNPDGHSYPVRTSDGGPLPLAGGQATIYDYEPPYDAPITYLTDVPGGPAAVTELDGPDPWLISPGVPSRSVRLNLRKGSNAAEDWDIDQGVFAILDRDSPIINTGGARQAPASTLFIEATTLDDLAALKLLLSDGSTLLLSVPPILGLGIDSGYIAVGKVQVTRQSDVGTYQGRDVTLPYQMTARPAGGTQAAITWATVAAQYPTWQSIIDAGISSWAELAAPTT